jgi:hypothetical protein
LDAAVPNYSRPEPPPDAEMKPIAGGMFAAWVPTSVTVDAGPGDSDPLEHRVIMDVDVVDGRLVCTRCVVESTIASPSVTAEALRRVPIARYLREAAANTYLVLEIDPGGQGTRAFVAPPKDFADKGMSEDVLRQVARIYQWAKATGDAPLGMLERDYGVARAKASRWIATARRRGLIADDDDGR